MPGPALAVGVIAVVAIGVLAYSIYTTQDHSHHHHHQQRGYQQWQSRSRSFHSSSRHEQEQDRQSSSHEDAGWESGRATGHDRSKTYRGARRRTGQRQGQQDLDVTSEHELQTLQSPMSLSSEEEANYQAAIRASLLDLETSPHPATAEFQEYKAPEYVNEKPASMKQEAIAESTLIDPFADPVMPGLEDWSDTFTDTDSETDKHSEESYL